MTTHEQIKRAVGSVLKNTSGLTQAELMIRLSKEFSKPITWTAAGPVVEQMIADGTLVKKDEGASRYTLKPRF
ncbi:MAG: hypothetical protein HY366_03395 [Candidatus Aenigmarchaeota archaeon]|nr:hypothetical protein [Candidatus Aenigmarchaeota archaeon]